MRTQPRTDDAKTREAIEQAVARGWTVNRIFTDLGVSYRMYRAVRDRMNDLDWEARAAEHNQWVVDSLPPLTPEAARGIAVLIRTARDRAADAS